VFLGVPCGEDLASYGDADPESSPNEVGTSFFPSASLWAIACRLTLKWTYPQTSQFVRAEGAG